MKNRLVIVGTLAFGITIGGLTASLFAKQGQPATPVVGLKLPLDLPAIGNVEAAENWRFGRIEQVVQAGAAEDVAIRIRTADGHVHQVIGPRVLRDLAHASHWTRPDTNNPRVSRTDYVERMVAFDVDASGRIIAMISMEPMDRNARRLKRGL